MLKKKNLGLSFWERFFGGHISVGPITIYGANAMHWAVNIYTKRWGYICFRLPFFCFGKWWPLYFYISPNATPWAATFYIGKAHPKNRMLASVRRNRFGHNFDVGLYRNELYQINQMI